jgi:hypothetical protein
MALRTPPSWLQQGSHPAENDRLSMQAIFATTGIVGASSLAVTANGTPNMSVNVAAGYAAIVGTTQSNMGVYLAYNDAVTNLTVTASNPSLPRIDRVVVTVNDAYYTGLLNNVTFTVVAGTPAASPTAPATPANSISLATIAVAAGATTIVSGNITDTRVATTTSLVDTSSLVSLTGTQTLTNKTLTSPIVNTPTISSAILNGATLEAAYTTGTGFAGYTFDVTTNGSVQYITASATASGTVNIRSTSGQALNALMANNQAITIVLAITNGATAYYPNAWQIDGTGVTPKWSGGTAPTAGNANAIDIYTLTIVKTASATYTVLANQTKFA